jgi:hypothetical protein
MLIAPSASGRANVVHVVEEVIMSRVDLTHARKGSGSRREAEECSFMSVSGSAPLCLSDIVCCDSIATGRVKAKGSKGVIIWRWQDRVIREIGRWR